jgi:predicted GNAT superfamily acetyltransferase
VLTTDIPPVSQASFRTRGGRSIQIRTCNNFDELDACVELQVETWGYSDGDVIPRRVFTVARRIGGQVIGAFDLSSSSEGRLIGFAMALPGILHPQDGGSRPYLHSHMLAVRDAYRNEGIGRRLKLFQRIEALSRGIELMEWTFDPLQVKNAFLNIHRLGAIVRSYTPNFYGVSSSRLQGELPTDRLHAEWFLRSAHVEAALNGRVSKSLTIEETILVPHQINEWRSSQQEVDRALAVQGENRRRFEDAFSRGLAVIGFHMDTERNGIFELGPFEG